MKSDMLLAVMQLAAERELPQGAVVSAFEDAIAAAYRREDEAEGYDVVASLNPETGDVKINTVLHVVDYIDELDPRGQVTVDQAQKIRPDAMSGDDIITGDLEFRPQRIAARTVTQVLMQRLRNAERQLVFEQFADKEGEVISAPIRRIDRIDPSRYEMTIGQRPPVMVDLGKADALLPSNEQPPSERYRTGMELRFYVLRVGNEGVDGDSAPEIVVSRTHPNLLRRLLEMEVPEVKSGVVELKSIAREPGARSKVAVYSNKHDIDPIGACVGLRGIRIQNIVTELMGEKIDILEWSDDPATFIANSLGPAQVERVIILSRDLAEVIVPDSQLSLAIGREGQNVGLATRLTGFRIDIKGSSAYAEEQIALQRELAAAAAAEEAAKAAAEEMVEDETELVEALAEEPLVESETEVAEIAIPVSEATEVSEEATVVEDEAQEQESVTPRAVPSLFVPAVPVSRTQAAPVESEPVDEPEEEPEPEEDLDLELLELEEKLRELEIEEQERLEAERLAADQEAIEQDIDSDDLWVLPGELMVESETQSSGLRFAEDIDGYRDGDAGRAPRRRGSNRGGPRRSSR